MFISYRDAEPEAFTENHKAEFMSTPPSNVSISPTRLPLAQTPAAPGVSFALFDPACFREVSPQKPQPASEILGERLLCIIMRDICLLIY